MAGQKSFSIVELSDLKWPSSLQLPTRRFRLFVAADSHQTSVNVISEFAIAALQKGAVYCCTWGRCSARFHDIIDEVVVEDGFRERRFVGPSPSDVIMTTCHADESLEEALGFLTTSALPTEGFAIDSHFLVVACVGNPEWAAIASRVLEATRCNA
jgi:hypothetical protein